jgi:hypothetical protein
VRVRTAAWLTTDAPTGRAGYPFLPDFAAVGSRRVDSAFSSAGQTLKAVVAARVVAGHHLLLSRSAGSRMRTASRLRVTTRGWGACKTGARGRPTQTIEDHRWSLADDLEQRFTNPRDRQLAPDRSHQPAVPSPGTRHNSVPASYRQASIAQPARWGARMTYFSVLSTITFP